jgi:hypothetical protein
MLVRLNMRQLSIKCWWIGLEDYVARSLRCRLGCLAETERSLSGAVAEDMWVETSDSPALGFSPERR